MAPYFTRDRFGRPQFLAGLLLVFFAAQVLWLVHVELRAGNAPDGMETVRIREGWKQWHGRGLAGAPLTPLSEEKTDEEQDSSRVPRTTIPGRDQAGFDTEHSPLLYLASAGPLAVLPASALDGDSSGSWRWLPRCIFLMCGILLGASLWYVTRRLCGNTGGFVALTFYCFSPAMIQSCAVWHTEPEIVAAWGAFGTVFTAIAVAHTLYAPREVVLWNWRRIVLLGISLGIAVGSQFSMIVLMPVALGFLLYVAPVRRGAGVVIWIAGCLVGLALLFSFYFFHGRGFLDAMGHAAFWGATWRGFAVLGVYKQVAAQIGRACPAMILALPVAIVSYLMWPRTRYFGNTAPLLMAVLFTVLGIAHPHVAGAGFLLGAMPFLFVFVSGVLADLMETRWRSLITAGVFGLMAAYVVWSLLGLARAAQG